MSNTHVFPDLDPDELEREAGLPEEGGYGELDRRSATKSPEEVLSAAIVALKGGDTGAHWTPDALDAARELFKSDRAAFQRKRSEIKTAHKDAAVTHWMRAAMQTDGGGDATKADELAALVTDSAELFHNGDGECFATFEHGGHQETWNIGTKGFAEWLSMRAYMDLEFSANDSIINQVIVAARGIAKFSGEERSVYLRCAPTDDGYLIDLCDAEWRAVHVTPNGWEIVNLPAVRFTRSQTAAALPLPKKGEGNLPLLWQYANIPEADRTLALAFLLESWRPERTFCFLALIGEQGSAKSWTHKILRQISDPNSVPLRSAPKDVQGIFVSAANNWQASFENMSSISRKMQDALCTLATGGGYAERKLYSDADESVISVRRPAIMNGISAFVTASDLADRTITIHLPLLSEYRTEAELEADIERDKCAIFTGLLDLFSATLREIPSVDIEKRIRLVDFAVLGEAMHQALGTEEPFLPLLMNKRAESLMAAIDSSPAARAVQKMMFNLNEWSGTFGELKRKLDIHHRVDGEGWPRSARGLSDILRRMAPALRECGIGVRFEGHGRDGSRVHVFSEEFQKPKTTVTTVTQSPRGEESTTCDDVTVVTIDSRKKNSLENRCPPEDERHAEPEPGPALYAEEF